MAKNIERNTGQEQEIVLNQGRRRKMKKKHPFVRAIVFLLIITLLLIGGLAGYLFYKVSLVGNAISKGTPDVESVNVEMESFAVLFIGSGTNGEDGQAALSDSINLFLVNPKKMYTEAIAIPRDAYLRFSDVCDWPSGEYDKITHAKDAQCLQRTLEETLDLRINYYVQLNFLGFVKIVDALGGVEMDVPDLRVGFENFRGDPSDGLYLDPDLKNGAQWCESDSKRNAYAVCFDTFGPQVVNGEQALALARTRHYDGDTARNLRQSALIKSIIQKATTPEGVLSINNLLDAIASDGTVKTNIPTEQFMSFANLGKTLLSNKENGNFAMRTTQLGVYPGTFVGETGIEASYARVPITELEKIREIVANTFNDGEPLLLPSDFYFNVNTDEAPTTEGDGIFLSSSYDIFNQEDVKRFPHKSSFLEQMNSENTEQSETSESSY